MKFFIALYTLCSFALAQNEFEILCNCPSPIPELTDLISDAAANCNPQGDAVLAEFKALCIAEGLNIVDVESGVIYWEEAREELLDIFNDEMDEKFLSCEALASETGTGTAQGRQNGMDEETMAWLDQAFGIFLDCLKDGAVEYCMANGGGIAAGRGVCSSPVAGRDTGTGSYTGTGTYNGTSSYYYGTGTGTYTGTGTFNGTGSYNYGTGTYTGNGSYYGTGSGTYTGSGSYYGTYNGTGSNYGNDSYYYGTYNGTGTAGR